MKFFSEDLNFKFLCKIICYEECKKGEGGECKWNYFDIVGVYFFYNKYFFYNGYKEEILKFLYYIG